MRQHPHQVQAQLLGSLLSQLTRPAAPSRCFASLAGRAAGERATQLQPTRCTHELSLRSIRRGATAAPWFVASPAARRSYATAPATAPGETNGQPQAGLKSRRKRRLGRNLAVIGVLGVGIYLFDEFYYARTLQRNLLTVKTGIAIGLDYKFNFDRNSLESIQGLHQRCADRLLYVCEKNQGLYVKIGQAVGANSVILPKPYHALAKMFDDADKMSEQEVRGVIKRELGKEPEEIFEDFDWKPIGAASIAQVHRARLRTPGKDGEPGSTTTEVAVKVQRPAIPRQAKMDLLCFRILLHLYERIFELPLAFAGQYISNQIEQETRFDHEAENSRRAREAILKNPDKLIRDTCYVPYVFPEHSTSRVLVMEYIGSACKVTDKAKLVDMGLGIKKVSQSLMEVFASQIFQSGFVQADGHPANVLVRKHPNGKRGQHQVVLIDHGLYVELSEQFRRQYAQLWKAIFEVDVKKLEQITTSWGMASGSSELFASATLLQPWKKPKAKGEQDSNHRKTDLEVQQEMKDKIKNFLVSVELIPKELIFVGRSMRIIQANNQVLGSPVNRLNILAKHAASALISPHTPSLTRVFFPRSTAVQTRIGERFREWMSDRFAFVKFRLVLFVLDTAFITSQLKHWTRFLFKRPLQALGLKRTDPNLEGKGFEDDLEKSMRKMARDEFGVELDEGAFMG